MCTLENNSTTLLLHFTTDIASEKEQVMKNLNKKIIRKLKIKKIGESYDYKKTNNSK